MPKLISIWSEKRSLVNVESHIRQYIEARQIFGSTHRYSFLYSRNGTAEELHRKNENDQWKRIGALWLRPTFAHSVLRSGQRLRSKFKNFVHEIRSRKLSSLDNKTLRRSFRAASRYHMLHRAIFKTSRGEFTTIAERHLKKILRSKKIPRYQLQHFFEILTTPTAFDEVNEEAKDWLSLVERGKPTTRKLLNHVDHYPWLVAHTGDPRLIASTLRRRYEQQRKHLRKYQIEVRAMIEQKERLRAEQKKLLRSLRSKTISYLAWLFQELSLERMRLKGGWAGSDYLYYPLYREIAQRTDIPLRELYSTYRIDEILKALTDGTRVAKDELNKRKQAYLFVLRNGKIEFLSGSPAEKSIEKTLAEFAGNDNAQITGTVASAGIAQGNARIIIPGDVHSLVRSLKSFRQGEVLVTIMTQPNMVPIMKRARAIVTDEGGLTSHASIIARELRIPCVVGTQFATKRIQTGDKVEVNANRGVVTILSSFPPQSS